MNRVFAILFSVLLLVAQAMAAATPANPPHCAPKASCCGDQCDCSVSTSSDATPAQTATAPVPPHLQLFLAVPVRVLFESAAPENLLRSAASHAVQPTASLPLFRLNCTLLI